MSSPASASPDTFIDILEDPIGVSETHLFTLRMSTDNLGYYEAMRVEVYLVELDWQTGAETTYLIDRFVRSSDYAENGEILGYSIKRDEGVELRDPYRIVQARGAVPWLAAASPVSSERSPQIASNPDSMVVQYWGDTEFLVSKTAIQARLDEVGAFMAENVVDHPRSSTMTTRQYFADRRGSVDNCQPEELLDFWVPGRARLPMLLRISCASDEDSERTSLVVQLPPADGVEAGK
ncbi:MAG: hypothetical protein AAGK01_09550 [Pseudomonadota bacterium]